MNKPAELQILDAVAERLANINQANGYYTTAASIERARTTPWRSGDVPALNYWTLNSSLQESGGGWRRRVLPLYLDYRATTRDRPFLDVAYELAHDLEVALRRAPGAPAVSDPFDPRLGELVEALEWTDKTPAIGEGTAPVCGAVMEWQITYSHPIDDSTTLLGA